jgi:hypothetical protein
MFSILRHFYPSMSKPTQTVEHGESGNDADTVLATYRVGAKPLYLIGTFETGVTVFSQQVRALNLIWALIDTKTISSSDTSTPFKIAIVGCGFAGLSAAAGLLKKRANVALTIFEERHTLLPMQQGSDSRWLHPRIYDWPGEGAGTSNARLPVLDWRAPRASDVVVQILAAWDAIVADVRTPLALYCNTRYLQIHEVNGRLQVEWVGERRNARDATLLEGPDVASVGKTDNFDAVILAVGLGLEIDGVRSYWRNETIGQPNLDQPHCSYLVSGQGDGAMIDLFRLRISQFRQDRILYELFNGKTKLVGAIRSLQKKYADGTLRGLFDDLEALTSNSEHSKQFDEVKRELMRRLRGDTEVILHLKVRKLSELFDPAPRRRISFQNKLLIYLLYKCGAFFPSSLSERELRKRHSIAEQNVIRRHGTLPSRQLERALSETLYKTIEENHNAGGKNSFVQSDRLLWPDGFFGYPGPSEDVEKLKDEERVGRKEYLPGPTALLATAFCASIAGALHRIHPQPERLRVTLHRSISFGDHGLLQQACEYFGATGPSVGPSTAARTFPARNATIGLAYRCRRIVRSRMNIDPKLLREAMATLRVHAVSRTMSERVGFVLAIPIVQPEQEHRFVEPNPVAGVIYVDSEAPGFFVPDEELRSLVSMAQMFVLGLIGRPIRPFEMIQNQMSNLGTELPVAEELPANVRDALELVADVEPPRILEPFQLNFDYSEFAVV